MSLVFLNAGATPGIARADNPGPGHGPDQQSGTAAGRAHVVAKDATRAEGGNGRARRHGKGELGDFVRRHPTLHPFNTGVDPRGFDVGSRKRIAKKSGARMDLYQDAEGRQQAHLSAAKLNYRDSKGDWQPVDTALTHRSAQFTVSSFAGPFGATADPPRYSETANDIDVEMAGRANDPALMSIGPDDTHSIQQALTGAAPVVGKVDGSDISYADVLADTDLVISGLSEGFRDTLILKSASAPTTFTFPLALQGLTAKINDAGGIDFLDADGKVVASSPHGHMNDARPDETGEGTRSEGVTYSLVAVDKRPAIQVDVDRQWVQDPARKFPIQLDPATYADNGDTYADNTTPSTDHSGDSTMGMGVPSTNRLGRAYMQFALQSAPPGLHTTAATLHLWLTYVTTCSALPFEVRSIRSSWTPAGTTTYSSTQPQPGNTILGTATPSVSTANACGNSPVDPNKGVNVDVQLTNNITTFDTWNPYNYGLMLKAADESQPFTGGSTNWKRFDTDNSAHPPTLDVTYAGNTPGQVDGRAIGSVNSLSPELIATAHDPDLFPNAALKYRFKVFKATDDPNVTGTGAPTAVADSAQIVSNDWVVPAGKLSWGADYVWTVQTFDGQDYGPPDGNLIPIPFTPTVRQPAIGTTLTRSAGEHGFDSNTGNLTTSATDAAVTTLGPGLSIKRSYNSRDARTNGLFGAGWSTQLDMTLTEVKDPSGSSVAGAILTYDNGQQAGFNKDSSGVFTPGDGFFGTLTPITGGYTFTDNASTVWTFTKARTAPAGAYGLTKVTDGTNYTLTYTWTGDQITKATTASGRALSFTWTTPSAGNSAHVATVTTDRANAADPNSAVVWSYTYNGDQLTKACQPVIPPAATAACTQYTYQNGSHFPTVQLDSDPYAYWRLGESSGLTANDAVVDNQHSLDAAYTGDSASYTVAGTASPAANSPAAAVTLKSTGTGSWITVPADMGFDLNSTSLSLWFKTTTADKVLAGWHDDPLGPGATTLGYIPDLYIGTDGKLRGQLGGGSGRPITTTGPVTDGQWHQAVITSQAATATQTLYLDGAKVGTLNQAGYLWRPTPITPTNQSVSARLTIGAGYIGPGWPGQSQTTSANASYFVGSLSDVAIHTRALSPAEVAAAYAQASTGPAALLTSVTTPAGRTSLAVPTSYNVPAAPPATGTVATVPGWDVARDAVQAVTDANGGTWTVAAPAITGSSTGLVGAVRTAGPLAYWRLGEGVATQAVDDGGDPTHLAGYNKVTLAQTGPFGLGDSTAAGFDGTSSQINAPTTSAIDLANRAANSVSVWFQTPANATTGGILFGYAAAPVGSSTVSSSVSYVQALYVGTTGYLYGSMGNGSVNPIASTTKVNDGNWHQATLTNAGSGGTQYLYLDGLPVTGTRPGVAALPNMNNDTFGAGFAGRSWPAQPYGASSLGTPWRFTGNLAEISAYTKALTGQQVYSQWLAYQKATTSYPIKTINVTDPLGVVLTDRYDPVHTDRILSHTDTYGHTTTMGYDTRGFQNSVTDGNGISADTGRDTRSNLVSNTVCQNEASKACSTTTWVIPPYSAALGAANDKPTTLQAPTQTSTEPVTKYQTDSTYNTLGEPTQVQEPVVNGARPTTTITYTDANTVAEGGGHPPVGMQSSVTDPAGKNTSYTYYANGDLATLTNPLGLVTHYVYDGLGRILTSQEVSDTYPSGLTTTFVYDALGRPVTRIDPNLTDGVTTVAHTPTTTTVYDADSFVTSTTISDSTTGGDGSRTVTHTADSRGRLTSTTDATGAASSFGYDVYGNRTSVTAADGTITLSAYDNQGRLQTTALKNYTGDPSHPGTSDLITHSYAYDFAGRPSSDTDAMGWSDLYTYFDDGSTATHIRTNAALNTYKPGTCVIAASGATDNTNCFVLESDTYDGAGNLTTRVANNGATTTTYTYDTLGRQATETLDPSGLARVTTTTYNAANYVANTTLTGGGVTQSTDYAVDAMGNQKSVTVHDGSALKTTTWTRDKRGLITSMIDPLGNATNPVTLGHETDYLNDEAGHQVAVIAPSVPTETGVEGASPLTLTPITRTGYNTFGDQVSTQDAKGNRTITDYDGTGRARGVTSPTYTPPGGGAALTPQTLTTYDSLGRVTDEQDALGNHTTHTWNQLGFELTRTLPGAATTTMTYDSLGDLLSTTSPTNARHESTWDYQRRKITDTAIERNATDTPCAPPATSSSCYTTTSTYGTGGWLAQQTTAANVVTKYLYNAAGERTSTTEVTNIANGTGNTTTSTYDLAGRLTSTTLPDQTSHKVGYDISGNQTATTDTDQNGATLRTTAAAFDLADRQISATDARGNQTTWTRDAGGAVTAQTEPVASGSTLVTSYAHDPRGNQTRFTDGRGNPFLTAYNSWNLPETRIEPTTTAHPAPTDRTWTTTYDAMQRAVRDDAPGGVSTTRSYDARGNLTDQTGTGAEASTTARSFGYDGNDRLIAASAPGSGNAFTWDDRGDLTGTTGGSGNASFSYNPDARMTARTDAAGTSNYTWDVLGRLATIKDAATTVTATRTYDNVNQLKTITYGSGGAVRTRAYDDLHRITADTLTAPGGPTEASITYGYDKNDNEISKTTAGLTGAAANTYTYDASDRLTGWGNGAATTTYTYDASGNRTGMGTRSQIFDARNRITSATDGASTVNYTWTARGTLAGTTGAVVRAVTYDAFDQIATDTAAPGSSGTGTQAYTYDALGREINAGPTGSGTGPINTLDYSGIGNDLAADSGTTYALDPDGGQVANKNGGTAALALSDRHDDVIGAYAATGTALNGSRAYDPLGKVIATNGTMFSKQGFQGDWTDPTTGQVDMWHRAYDPISGLFNSRDTADNTLGSDSVTADRYAYGNDNPLTMVDPTGFAAAIASSVQGPTRGTNGHGKILVKIPFQPDKNSYGWYYAWIDKNSGSTDPDTKAFGAARLTNGGFVMPAQFAGEQRKVQDYDNKVIGAAHNGDVGKAFDAVVINRSCFTHFNASCAVQAAILALPAAGKALEGVAGAARVLGDATDVERAGKVGTACLTHSFAPTTPVLLASGLAVPISDIHVGDRVKATDPATGHTSDRAVTAVMVHHDDQLLDLRVLDAQGTTSTIHATAHHPFWDDTLHRWVEAASLQQGNRLHTPDGDVVTVEGLIPVPGTADMWDLTVDHDHTFYVTARGADGSMGSAVLVHNTTPCPGINLANARRVSGHFPDKAGPHEVLVRRDATGAPTHYQVYDGAGLPIKRVDLTGESHGGIPTPHVLEYVRNTNKKTGQTFVNRGITRPAKPEEIP